MNYNWVFYSFIAMWCIALHSIIHKFISIYNINNTNVSLAFTFLIIGILAFVYLLLNTKSIEILLKNKNCNTIIILSLFLAFFIFFSNFTIAKAVSKTSNVGKAHLIINSSIIIVIVFSYFIFKEKLNYKNLLGILLTVLGLYTVINNS